MNEYSRARHEIPWIAHHHHADDVVHGDHGAGDVRDGVGLFETPRMGGARVWQWQQWVTAVAACVSK